MTKIFISYRRDDSQYVTDSIHDYLKAHFGDENVFLDVESIPFGVNFREYLAEQIAAHDVVLVIIGTDWARIMQERADHPNDFVRIEIESALAQEKLIIPVLVKESKMPNFSDLPESISELQWLNSTEIRRKPYLEDDCRRLAEGIGQHFGESKASVQPELTLSQPFDWIDIPAGEVAIEAGVNLNKPTKFDVPVFKIAKYPVTVAQYEIFVHDDGYQNAVYWSQTGWEWRQQKNVTLSRYWHESQWHGFAHPVVGVSWYEAYAFAQWLSRKLNVKANLPTEQQWQRAAQGDENRKYPWGNNWDETRCNNSVNQDWRSRLNAYEVTSAVSFYENIGRSPFGCVDMSGNVWEWCLNQYNSSKNNVESDRPEYVLRGGSWKDYDRNVFSTSYRLRYFPHVRNYLIGFRLARSD